MCVYYGCMCEDTHAYMHEHTNFQSCCVDFCPSLFFSLSPSSFLSIDLSALTYVHMNVHLCIHRHLCISRVLGKFNMCKNVSDPAHSCVLS